MLRLLLFLIPLPLIFMLSCKDSHKTAEFEIAPLSILTQNNDLLTFDIEIAKTPEQHQKGLMFRAHLPQDQGMLFDFGKEQTVHMWMKNTFIPLDMLFISKDKKIMHIAENTTPQSEELVYSPYPVQYVLELNAHTVENKGIKTGDQIIYEK